jgi:hypothetical protein
VSRDGDLSVSSWRMDAHQQLVGPVCQSDVPATAMFGGGTGTAILVPV